MAKEVVLRTKVDEDTHKRLRVQAAREGVTREEFIRDALLVKMSRRAPQEAPKKPEGT